MEDFAREFWILLLSILGTFGILITILTIGALVLNFLTKDWVKRIKSDVETSTKKEWDERES